MAKNTPAFQFYPSDFLSGTALLTLEAKAVYMQVLCHLWIHGNLLPFCYNRLSSITQTTPSQFEQLWAEFGDKFEIFDGSFSHPRFTKMMDIAEKRRESGSVGGKSKANNLAKGVANAKQTPSKSLANSLKNEERRMKNEDRSLETEDRKETTGSDLFNQFWSTFPRGRKTKKGNAATAWKKAIAKANPQTIIDAAAEYAASHVGQSEYVQGPEPWLNGECWDDDREAWKEKQSNGKHPKTYVQIGAEQTASQRERFLGTQQRLEAK